MSNKVRLFLDEVKRMATADDLDYVILCNGQFAYGGNLTNVMTPPAEPKNNPRFTFRDIKEWAESADTDDSGHVELYPGKMSLTNKYPYNNRYCGAHIYIRCTQVNFTISVDDLRMAIPDVCLVFDYDEVKVVKVNPRNGVADYDHPYYFTLDTYLDTIRWDTVLGSRGREFSILLNDLLTCYREE